MSKHKSTKKSVSLPKDLLEFARSRRLWKGAISAIISNR